MCLNYGWILGFSLHVQLICLYTIFVWIFLFFILFFFPLSGLLQNKQTNKQKRIFWNSFAWVAMDLTWR